MIKANQIGTGNISANAPVNTVENEKTLINTTGKSARTPESER